MRNLFGMKRVLSVLLTVALLLSSVAVAGVSAAATSLHSATYDSQAEQNYYANAANVNDHYTNGHYGLALSQATGGHTAGDGTDGCMALTGANNSGSNYVGYRFTSGSAGKVSLTTGTNYCVTLWYKVTSFGSEKRFGVANQSKAWGSQQVSLTLLDSVMITAADVAKGWQQATFTFTGAANNGLHIAMMAGADNTVLVDDVQVYLQATSTLTFRDTDISPITGNMGDPITYPTAPTRDGYDFVGWFTESGDPAPATFPADDLTLVAKWQQATPSDVWGFESEAVGTELALGNHATRKATVTDAEHKSGAHALKLTGNDKSGYARPQVMIKDPAGAQVTVEQGKKYEISYWIKVPSDAGTTQINWWLTASADDTVYGNSDDVNADRIYQQNMMSVTADTWQKVTATIDACDYSGKLRLGISGNRFGAHSFYIDDFAVRDVTPSARPIISFSGEGVNIAPISGTPGEPIPYPTAPTRDGYIFAGWKTPQGADAPTVFPAENLTLVAQWEVLIPAPVGVWSFETEAVDTELALGNHATRKATVTAAEHKSGAHALKLTGNDKSGYARPQVMIKDQTGVQVTVRQGRSYEISYWIKVPSDAGTTEINWWLTASANDTVYSSSDDVNANKIYSRDRMAVTADTWQEVRATIDNCEYSGLLRLGISGNRFGAHSFYIDDVKVEEILPLEANEGVLTFENGELDADLALNGSTVNRIVVSDAITAKSGTKVGQVTSNERSGNSRPQMLVKTDLGEQLRIYKGRSYEFKFSIYIPTGSESYGINYWIAAVDNERMFGSGNAKDTYVLAEVTNGSQPKQGEWTELTLTVTDAPVGGKLRLGITGNTTTRHTFYIDDISLRMTEPADAMNEVQSFEDYAPNDQLSVNTDAASITATDEDVHTGFKAAKVVTVGNAVDTMPQMPLIDYMGEPMAVQKGMKYQLSFYAMIPYGEEYDLQCWLAVVDNDEPFSATNPRTGVVMDTVTVTATDRGGWQFVTLTIDKAAVGGNLRLGISGSTDAVHTFYLDDMAIRERSALPGDPDAMNFERYEAGEEIQVNRGSSSVVTVSDEYSYTGNQSARVDSHEQSGDYRPQFNLTDAQGNYLKLKKGDDCYLSFMIHLPTISPNTTAVTYWLAFVPEDQADQSFNNSTFTKNDHKIYEATFGGDTIAEFNEWTKITVPILNCPGTGVLRLGMTHTNYDRSVTNYIYLDDFKIEPPKYVTVKFDTNGSESKIDDIVMLAGSLIPFTDADPYLDGSDFMGWYTSKEFKKADFFDINSKIVEGEDGDVLTLYACWRKWDDGAADIVLRDDELKNEYVVEYYDETVWVDGQNGESPYADSQRPEREEAAPIVVTPQDDRPESESGMPPWLIVVIAACAVVVVGGGAVIAAILLKKNKKV